MGRRGVVFFLSRQRRTSSTAFLRSCPGGGSRKMISHSRKVSINGSNFPKNRLFRVQRDTLFVPRPRVTGKVLRRLDYFPPVVDIPQIYLPM